MKLLGKLGKLQLLMFAAGVAVEMVMLYRSEKKYTPRQRAKLYSRKVVDRPNRAGHFVGNLIRVVHRRLTH